MVPAVLRFFCRDQACFVLEGKGTGKNQKVHRQGAKSAQLSGNRRCEVPVDVLHALQMGR